MGRQEEGEGRNIVTLKSQKSDSVIKILKQFGQSYRVSFKAFLVCQHTLQTFWSVTMEYYFFKNEDLRDSFNWPL